MNRELFFAGLVALAFGPLLFGSDRVVFPDDPSVIDVKKQCGAKGDGKTDDTAALQKALDESCGPKATSSKVVWIPNGTYRLTGTLVVNKGNKGSGLGAWLYGESRDGVILKLDDNLKDVKSLLLTHPTDEGATSANWFFRNFRNFTLDVGNNPTTDGIRYMATNEGIIQNVTIKGNGNVGINAGFIGESGPNNVQDVAITGFDTGIKSHWCYGQTLSRITIKNCRTLGVHVIANVVALEDLIVENTPQALFVDYPKDWTWWSGVVALVGGKFTTEKSDQPAIRIRGHLFARDVTSKGYTKLIAAEEKAQSVEGMSVEEYASHGVVKAYAESATKVLRLPIKREPVVDWETDPKKWVCVSEYGAKPGDNQDDTAAVQKALDAAAKDGKTVVYFRGIGGGDPNWYNLKGELKVTGSVRQIIGLGFGRVLGGTFVVDDTSAPVVRFQHLYGFGGKAPSYENRSAKNTVVIESAEGTAIGNGGGDIFMTNTPAQIHLKKKGQNLWARGLNPEGTTDDGLVQNEGGNLWVLGSKTEGKGKRYKTSGGGKSELYGCYEYSNTPVEDQDERPMFEVIDGSLSVAATREVCFTGKPFVIKLIETRGTETKRLKRGDSDGTISLLSAVKK
jgi:hypothetical protein